MKDYRVLHNRAAKITSSDYRGRLNSDLDHALYEVESENAALREAAEWAFNHVCELEEAWRTGAIEERDGLGGTRSNRNVDVRVALAKALGKEA